MPTTHFIEQFREKNAPDSAPTLSSGVHTIEYLQEFLEITKNYNLKTVAVFLITPKEKNP